MTNSFDLNTAARPDGPVQDEPSRIVRFRFEFDEMILDHAYQYHNERGSAIVQFFRYVGLPFMLLAYLLLIAGIIIEPGTDWKDIGMLGFGGFLFLGEFIHIKRVSKSFSVAATKSFEVCYTEKGITFNDLDSSLSFDRVWADYERWFERQGLLLLYRRRKLFDLLSRFDVIDLNQVPESEESSLMEIVRTNVSAANTVNVNPALDAELILEDTKDAPMT